MMLQGIVYMDMKNKKTNHLGCNGDDNIWNVFLFLKRNPFYRLFKQNLKKLIFYMNYFFKLKRWHNFVNLVFWLFFKQEFLCPFKAHVPKILKQVSWFTVRMMGT